MVYHGKMDMQKTWKFSEPKNVAVITTKKILIRESDIVFVSHDADDGMWQFLDSFENDETSAAIIGLGELVNIDSSVTKIADLPLGWIATRENKNADWIRYTQ
ncbi:MAG: hypothetical protein Ta2G_17770 [Termitinemataceae bacterium]|nr:MAG: hypothetical protein Ta2G_17770 [Termitinemataceae bacterium]